MDLYILLMLCISTMALTVMGQDEFFFKVGQGFEQGRQISGWGNRNQWLQQVRGSKRPPSLKELEKWWNSPPKNVGNEPDNTMNSEEPDIPFEDNNGGFVPSNWNFGPQSGGVMSPTKDPLPPFTKDAALRIKDYAALLRHGPRTPKWGHRGKGKRHRQNRPHRQHMKKFVRKHKGAKHNPLNACWSPHAYECDMHQENISPGPKDLLPYGEVHTNYDIVGAQPIGRLPPTDFYQFGDNWDAEKENQNQLNNHRENWESGRENQNELNNYRENWESERENQNHLNNNRENWETGGGNQNQLNNNHENWESERENQNQLNNNRENWESERDNHNQLNNNHENWESERENQNQLNNNRENWESERENQNQLNNNRENWEAVMAHQSNFKNHRENWKAVRGHQYNFKNHRESWKAVRGHQNNLKNHHENWKAVGGHQNTKNHRESWKAVRGHRNNMKNHLESWKAIREHQNHLNNYRQNEDQNYGVPIAHTSPNSLRDAHQNNYFRNSYKYSNWRALPNHPTSLKNYRNSENLNLRKQKGMGRVKSTWIAPVYSWHDQPNELSLMTKELATLYNGGGRYRMHTHNVNRHSNRKHRLAHQEDSAQSTPINPQLSQDWNSPYSGDQMSNSWSNDVQKLISGVRNSVFEA